MSEENQQPKHDVDTFGDGYAAGCFTALVLVVVFLIGVGVGSRLITP